MYDLKDIGKICKSERMKKGYTQRQLAIEFECSSENISAFECGRNNSLKIFLWYLINIFDLTILEEYFEVSDDEC